MSIFSRLVLARPAIMLTLVAAAGIAGQSSQAAEAAADKGELLKERVHWENEANRLRAAGKAAEAIESAGKMLVIERRLFGEVHEDVAGSLTLLAELREEVGNLTGAGATWREVAAMRRELHGKDDWRTGDALRKVADVKHLGELPADRRQRLAEAAALNRQVLKLYADGKASEAVPLAQRALATIEEIIGAKHPSYAQTLNNLAALYASIGEHAKAEPLYRQAMQIRSEVLGEKHPDYTETLNNLAALYYSRGEYAAAEPLYRRAIQIEKEVLGEKHSSYATSLNNLGASYVSMGKHADAELLLRQALEIRRELVGDKHPDFAETLGNLAKLFQSTHEYAKAEPLYQQVMQISKEMLGERHPYYATSLDNLGRLYDSMGEYVKAERYYLRTLQLDKEVVGEKHPHYATSLGNLALLYVRMGHHAKTERLYREALEIFKESLGDNHPSYASTLNNLAQFYVFAGDYTKAEPLHQRALRIRKEVLGEKHSAYAASLNDLATLYSSMGAYAKAEPLYRQSMEICKAVLGERHPAYASSLNNLAMLYHSMGAYVTAEPLYRQSMEIRKAVLGEKHPDYAESLNNLALLYDRMGAYGRAEPLYRDAIHIVKGALGERHPSYATNLNNLALLYDNMGEYAKAEALYRQAIEINAESLGVNHVSYAVNLGNLAELLHGTGRATQALEMAERAATIAREVSEAASAVQSENTQLSMERDLRLFSDIHLRASAGLTDAGVGADNGYGHVLARKGTVSARQRLTRTLRAASRTPQAAKVAAELEQATRSLANLTLAPASGVEVERRRRRDRMAELTVEIERLQVELAGLHQDFRRTLGQVRRSPTELLKDLRAEFPEGTALVDFIEYSRLIPPAGEEKLFKRHRYLAAFVLRKGKPVVRVELGPSQAIEEQVQRWRSGYGPQAGRKLRKLVWEKLSGHVGDAKLVLVSPDGALCRLPLGALPGAREGTYLLEELALATVPVPRLLPELLAEARQPPSRSSTPSLLAVGDVDFDAEPGAPTVIAQAAAEHSPLAMSTSRSAPRDGASLRRWGPLGATGSEVSRVTDLFRRRFGPTAVVEDLRKVKAGETEFRRMARGKAYLHLATHGFFADAAIRSALAASSRAEKDIAHDLFQRRDVTGWHPGLLSGIVLAGANKSVDPEKDDGILTALEVCELDLGSVQLAVLSACETGLGESAGGEGLLGLQRAFQVAGTKSVVAGLWQVDDLATQAVMERFYANLWERNLGKLEALREAQLWMLRHGRKWMEDEGRRRGLGQRGLELLDSSAVQGTGGGGGLSPYFWAGFVLSGQWE